MIRLDYSAVIICDTELEVEWLAEQLSTSGYDVIKNGELKLTATLHQEYEVGNG